MAGLKGVAIIADDLVVHGKDSEEHDRNLIKVLERLKERGLTVSEEKCTFRMTKVVFMGLLLTRHRIGPTKEKVRAVVEASQPQCPSEVGSFLGLVGFSARFIPDFSTTADPLRKIARQGESFIWGEEQEKSFKVETTDCKSACLGILRQGSIHPDHCGCHSSGTWSSAYTREEWGTSCRLLCQQHLKQC